MMTWLKSTFHSRVARYHLGAGRAREAVDSWSAAIRLSPTSALAHLNRGVAFQHLNDHRGAISDFDRALAIGFNRDAFRALAHANRAISWKVLGDLDRAAADFKEALVSAPRLAAAHEELGIIARAKHDFEVAMVHLDRAVTLSPRRASHYRMRGLVHLDRGDFAAAETDLRYAINIAADAYALLFWYIASCKLGRNAVPELASRARELKGRQWPFAVVTLYLGQIDGDALRAAASTSEQRAEAEFYIGEWHLLAGRPAEGIASLHVAAESCPILFMEKPAAVMELKRQGKLADTEG